MTPDNETIEEMSKTGREPVWLADLRRKALATHQELPWPHPSDDIWRRTDVSLLDPSKGFASAAPSLVLGIPLSEAQLARYTQPLGEEALLVRGNGSWITQSALPQGVRVQELGEALQDDGAALRHILESDGLTKAEQKLATLNTAFHHDDVVVRVGQHVAPVVPIRLVHLLSVVSQQALYPLTVITVGTGSTLTLIDEYVSLAAQGAEVAHLVNARIEIVLESGAALHYVRLQRWGAQAREFVLQRATLGTGATFTMANLNLGAQLSKAHLVTKLTGEHSSAKLYGFVFGHGAQHVDQHTLQDHQAPNTTSDLEFRAALKDSSRMVYTGLIRIGKDAVKTSAYQSNHNLMLSDEAKAETIPMLEILADDVQCKHGASIGPIDDEQAFYLQTRGIARDAAQRLIVMGFVESVIRQVPFAPLQQRLRDEIEGGL